jgi:uncharacterized tellurite resistance protein B-like protein
MLDSLKRFFNQPAAGSAVDSGRDTEHDVRIATCALFLEMARIDEKFTEEEMDTILSIMKEKYGLDREHADALVAEADKELAESVDLWQFARLINKNYSIDEKMMNKLKNLLRLSQGQLIDAKLKVLHSG